MNSALTLRVQDVLYRPSAFNTMPYASVRWIDINNRSHTWSGVVASTDRRQIIHQVKAFTGAKEVIIQSVRG